MRPVNKGKAPRNYKHYSEAKDDLRDRLGSFCSYCEMNISMEWILNIYLQKVKIHI